MNSLAFLVIVCILYYCANRYFPERLNALSENHRYYFGGGVVVYLAFWYVLVYESSFVHKVFHNVYNSEQPLYTKHSALSNASYYHQQNPNANIKAMLLMRQGHRCYKCSNYIVDPENDAKLSYKILPKFGGKNDTHNLVSICRTCSEFM